jgi:predicted dehydrogenase
MDLGIHWLHLVEYVSNQPIEEITALFTSHQPDRVWRGRPGEGARPDGTATPEGGVAVRVGLEDQADLLIRLKCGAAGSATISGVSPGHPNTIVLSVDGSERGFEWNQQEPNTYVEYSSSGNTIRQREPEALPAEVAWMSRLPAGHPEGYLDAFRNIVSQAWSAMRGNTDQFPSFADGLRGIELIEAAVTSAKERRPASVA